MRRWLAEGRVGYVPRSIDLQQLVECLILFASPRRSIDPAEAPRALSAASTAEDTANTVPLNGLPELQAKALTDANGAASATRA